MTTDEEYMNSMQEILDSEWERGEHEPAEYRPNIKRPIPIGATPEMIAKWEAAYSDYYNTNWDRSHFG